MTYTHAFDAFAAADLAAVAFLLVSVWGIGWRIDREGARRPSVTVLMMRYRREWMTEMLTRDPRVFDASIIGILRQSTAFFASTSVIAIGGVLALIGNAERIDMVATELGERNSGTLVWQIKLALVAALLTSGFLRFVWSSRLYGYCAVVMAAAPNDPAAPNAPIRASQAAEINIRAASNFNRGLRYMYFALAALAWLVGPAALGAATAVTLWVIWSREFASKPHTILDLPPDATP
ncbi:DUF599 domain-containing protein [Palleronia sediminis]|uniref:DUF599 domain-containing protein n=1 Tax=Palleronia sediminis TaxID=2547833 RepID=A0A4V3B9M5_9RHOB|nr:DUF599 domain-containing protein [Palleronia sediminis]TDL79809.1 DUF599 domain-containing protein [Palleronia sediminis]